MINKLECRLSRLMAIYSGKLIWGIDCNIDLLTEEIEDVYFHLQVLEVNESANNCSTHIPQDLIKKAESYIKVSSKTNSKFCKNC